MMIFNIYDQNILIFTFPPNFQWFILRATHDTISSWIETNIPDNRRMSFKSLNRIVLFFILFVIFPNFDSIIKTAATNHILTWNPLCFFNILIMSIDNGNTREFIHIIIFPNPNWFISSTSNKKIERLMPINTFDFTLMTFDSIHTIIYILI